MKNIFRLIHSWIVRPDWFQRWKSNSTYSKNIDNKIKLIYRGISYYYNSASSKFIQGELGDNHRNYSCSFYQAKNQLKQVEITKQFIYCGIYRDVKFYQKLTQIQAFSDLTLSSMPILPDSQRPSTQLKLIEAADKELQPSNIVEFTGERESSKEIIDEHPEIIYTLDLNRYKLVLDKDIFKDKVISTSGEAEIWTITGEILNKTSGNYLAKIYHQKTFEQIQKLPERIKKLEVMVVHQSIAMKLSRNHLSLAWPQYLLEDSSGEVIGFLMPFIEGNKLLITVYHPKLRHRINIERDWQVNWQFLYQTAINIARIIQFLHTQGYVIGDMKPENILVNEQALPSIIDTDSFQIYSHQTGDLYRCLVGSEGFTPPELLGEDFTQIDQNPTHDNFRLAVIIYHLLFGEHPFKGHWGGDGDSPEIDDLIRQGFWCYAAHGLIQPGDRTIPLDIVHPQVKEYFLRCFNEGHHDPDVRPTAIDWANALQAALDDLVQCESFSSHWYSRIYGRCYWCERKEFVGKDIFSQNTEQYKRLNMLLEAENWKEADLETKYLMLKITSRIHKGWLDESAMVNFPLEDIRIINQLWLKHSSGRFGFTVQKRIYLETGNHPGRYDRETYNLFAEVVGWRKDRIWKNYSDLEFSLSAPDGHLPLCCAGFDVCLVSYLSSRF